MPVLDLTAAIVDAARARGFHRIGIMPVVAPATFDKYQAWLAADYHGDMAFLATAEHIAPRADLALVAPTAQTVIVVALAYQRSLPVVGNQALRGNIARYAAGEDYHIVMRDRLYEFARDISQLAGQAANPRPCVDSAPVLERDLARQATLGFVGKNTMLIAPGLGSYFVLGEVLIDIALPPTRNAPAALDAKRGCGSCRQCLDACPTGAFVDEFVLDARRCISYLTIEHRGWLPRELRAGIGMWIFGCDICQQVCPYNAGKGPADAPPPLAPRDDEHLLPDLVRLVTFGTNQLRQFVKRTAMRRAPREQIMRNIAVALGNSGDARAMAALPLLLAHRHPLVRGHAAWALAELCRRGAAVASTDILALLGAAAAVETQPDVAEEIALARHSTQSIGTTPSA